MERHRRAKPIDPYRIPAKTLAVMLLTWSAIVTLITAYALGVM